VKKIIRTILLSAITVLSISTMAFANTVPAMTKPMVESAPFTAAQTEQLDKIIHDYIVNNPQTLVEASQKLQQEQEQQMQTAAMRAVGQYKKELFDDAQSPSVGNKDASATVVEFFDYQCGHCRAMAPSIEKLIAGDKNLHFVFKELPIFGGMSQYAAKAALAAAMQPDKYYNFHTALLTTNKPITQESVMAIAKASKLNIAKLKKDMELPAIQQQLRDNFTLAQHLKIMGTPTFVISNKEQTKFAYIPGAISLQDLESKIKSVQ